MTENKRFTIKNERTLQDNLNGKAYVFSWKCDAEDMCNLLNELFNENEQLKKENQRMTDKLNELALEFLNYDMVTMGKATEISEMCYYDFLKYRNDNGNPMELQL